VREQNMFVYNLQAQEKWSVCLRHSGYIEESKRT